MARYFLDTSALVKQYHAEVGTPRVRTILSELNSEHLITRLATVEILSGFATKVRTVRPGGSRLHPPSWPVPGGREAAGSSSPFAC